MAKLRITAKDIRKMNADEWNAYRKSSWLKKRKYYEEDMPPYYLPNKDRYAQYLENIEKRPAAAAKLHISSKDIRKMNEEQWNEYRKNSWLKKRKFYQNDMNDYYLPNQEKYAQFLEKVEKRINAKK